MKGEIILAQSAVCDIPLIRRMRQLIINLLRNSGETLGTIEDLQLACSEHLANLVKHAGVCRCDVVWCPQRRALIIRDDGPDASKHWQLVDELGDADVGEPKTSGMGLMLIKTLFPNMSYENESQQPLMNCLTLPLNAVKPRIVIVDDDLVFLALIDAYLQGDYHISSFQSASEALLSEALTEAQLIICDIHMPGTSGREMRETLLEQDETSLIPFVFLTGDTDEHIKRQASHLQIDDYLTKPVEKSTLLTTVQRVLYRSSRLRSQFSTILDHSISRTLWPKGPWDLTDCQIAYEYSVAERGGGDFLFYCPLTDRYRFVLGDVMGHGEQAKHHACIVAGLLTGLCHAVSVNEGAAQFMSRVSDAIAQSSLLDSTVVTLQVIDVFEGRNLSVCSAGHPAPLYFSADGSVRELASAGPLPGLASVPYQDVQATLLPGESLLFYSDGLIESLLLAEETAQLRQRLEQMDINAPVSRTAAALAKAFSLDQRQLDDDVTLLTII